MNIEKMLRPAEGVEALGNTMGSKIILFRHVTKSIDAMANALHMDTKPAQRDADEKIPELKKAFLDLSVKMNSPTLSCPKRGCIKSRQLLKN